MASHLPVCEWEDDVSRGFISTINKMAKEAERARKAQERAKVRFAKSAAKQLKQLNKFERESYHEARQNDAKTENERLLNENSTLCNILESALNRNISIDFDRIRKKVTDRDLDADPLLRLPEVPMLENLMPEPLGFFQKFIPGAKGRYRKLAANAETEHAALLNNFEAIMKRRTSALGELQKEADRYNAEISALRDAYKAGEAEGVIAYFEAVFQQSEYPDCFSQEHNIAFLPDSRQIVVDYEIPSIDETVPVVEKYRYIKSKDEFVETKRTEKSRQSFYASILAQTALRLFHEVFASDVEHVVEVAVINIYVPTIDKATGHSIRPCLISARLSAEQFAELHLERVEPTVCLKQLRANVSSHPSELVAVKPIIDINMVDRRFIDEANVLSTLDSRPNLMELTPGEFESLITNLFKAMGLEARLTQSSRDGGVDCVAFDQRPIFGGKVVIQAKRYKHTVGVSAVRDLYGTMMNEGASKGILVTTSGYGKAAFEFANGKPIELISGGNLLSLLSEHAGIEAKIQVPDIWIDPPLQE